MKPIAFIVIILLFFSSCQVDSQRVFLAGRVVVSSFPEEEKTLTAAGSFSGSYLEGVYMMEGVADSLIVFSNRIGSPYCFRLLNLRDSAYVDFLRRGRGPDEVDVGFSAGLRNSDGVTYFDVDAENQHFLLSIDVFATFKEREMVVKDKINVLKGAHASYPLGEEILSFVLYDEDSYSIKLYGKTGREIRRVSKIFGDESYPAEYQAVFESARTMKPDRTKLAMPMIFFDEIGIFDLEGEDHLSVSSSRRTDSKSKIEQMLARDDEPTQVYYRDCSATDDAIYALYCNCDVREVNATLPVIHVFSWDGQLKAVYHLNEYLYGISVSGDGKTLYGLTAEEVLYSYDLS